MGGVRCLLLSLGLVCLVGGTSELALGPDAPPWLWLEHHLRHSLTTSEDLGAIRVDLKEGLHALERAAAGTDGR